MAKKKKTRTMYIIGSGEPSAPAIRKPSLEVAPLVENPASVAPVAPVAPTTDQPGFLDKDVFAYLLMAAANAIASKAPTSGLARGTAAMLEGYKAQAKSKLFKSAVTGEPAPESAQFIAGPKAVSEAESLRLSQEKLDTEKRLTEKRIQTMEAPSEVERVRGAEQRKTIRTETAKNKELIRAKTAAEKDLALWMKNHQLDKSWRMGPGGYLYNMDTGAIVAPPVQEKTGLSEDDWKRSLQVYDKILDTVKMKFGDTGFKLVKTESGMIDVVLPEANDDLRKQISDYINSQVYEAIKYGTIHPAFMSFITNAGTKGGSQSTLSSLTSRVGTTYTKNGTEYMVIDNEGKLAVPLKSLVEKGIVEVGKDGQISILNQDAIDDAIRRYRSTHK